MSSKKTKDQNNLAIWRQFVNNRVAKKCQSSFMKFDSSVITNTKINTKIW